MGAVFILGAIGTVDAVVSMGAVGAWLAFPVVFYIGNEVIDFDAEFLIGFSNILRYPLIP